MSKETGTIVTIVVGILTFLCCTIPLCVGGVAILVGAEEWSNEIGPGTQTGTIPPAYGIAPCCLSILVLVVPLLLWVFLVRGQGNAVEEATMMEEIIAE
jgi:hypothetical protein